MPESKTNKFHSVAILGPGAVGGLLAAILWNNGNEVTCVAPREVANAINEQGLSFQSQTFGDFVAKPRAVAFLDISPDIVFITTKAYDLEAALERVKSRIAEHTIIVPLLNGLNHMEKIRALGSGQVIAGAIVVEAFRDGVAKIIHACPSAKIIIGSDDEKLKAALPDLADWLRQSSINVNIEESEAAVLWKKLVRLNALALVTSIARRPLGEIRHEIEWRGKIIKLLEEGIAVAGKLGVEIDLEEEMSRIDAIEPEFKSSMLRDIEHGRQTELDDIAGAIVSTGHRLHISTPVIQSYYQALRNNT